MKVTGKHEARSYLRGRRFCRIFYLCVLAAFVFMIGSPVYADGTATLKGQITDVEGRPVAGARVFAYDDSEVRRAANFMSVPADGQGRFRMVLMPGKYWLVARLKKGEEYGPLMPGDKHSGEPVVLDLAPGMEADQNFTVADLRDARKQHTKDRSRPAKISGKILNENGAPLTKSYAIAHRSRTVDGVPDYVSAWVDDKGRYTLYLPPGKYFIGSSLKFPPGAEYLIYGEITVDADKPGVDIIAKPRDGK